MAKLSMYARERAVALHFSGKNVTQIKKMLECEGIKTSRSAVSLFLSRYQNTGSLRDTIFPFGLPSVLLVAVGFRFFGFIFSLFLYYEVLVNQEEMRMLHTMKFKNNCLIHHSTIVDVNRSSVTNFSSFL